MDMSLSTEIEASGNSVIVEQLSNTGCMSMDVDANQSPVFEIEIATMLFVVPCGLG